MYLALVVTARCNAACTHCSTNCGPQRTESLPREKLLSLMDEAAELSRQTRDEWMHFSITGGEPFLDLPLLLEAIAHGHRLGAQMSCVSNAYWASSDAKARSLLARLKQAGLHLLCVSTSRFHQQFVKRTRVERALRIAREIGLKSQLKFVRTRSDPEDESHITEWAKGAGATLVQVIPLAPTLRADAALPDDEYVRRRHLPQERCPASAISIYETGAAYPCCTPGAVHPFFSLGDAHTSRLSTIRDRFHFGGKHQILRQHGPSYFARAIEKQGHGALLRRAYGNVCDLCTHIAHDPTMARIAEDAARQFELEQLRSILARAIGAPAEEASAVSINRGDLP